MILSGIVEILLRLRRREEVDEAVARPSTRCRGA
jgi:hypothetical protein